MRLLVVEDDPEIREFLKISLEAESFAVDTAADGEIGSYLAKTNDYDLIILDNVLPKKHGFQITAEIRDKGKTMPILILSVGSDTAQKVDLLSRGADDYLTKPYSFEELLARVRALLRRPRTLQSEKLTIDDLVLDNTNQTVMRGNKEIYLTRKEFSLLEYLLRNRGAVMSRGMIMDHVWDRQADLFSNTIETHILNLRRKIDFPGKKKLIQTVPGRGYKIELPRVEETIAN